MVRISTLVVLAVVGLGAWQLYTRQTFLRMAPVEVAGKGRGTAPPSSTADPRKPVWPEGKVEQEVTELKIGVKQRPAECNMKTKPGDIVHVHYTGWLRDGSQFDSSWDRGDPIVFELGQGRVISGWDRGLLNMCTGEVRKLKIPPALGYGAGGAPPKIPGGATLIFEAKLVQIDNAGGSFT